MKYLKNKGVLLVLLIYLVFTIIVSVKNIEIYTNIINPIFWFTMLIYSIIYIRNNYIRFCVNKKYSVYMIIISLLYFIFYYYLGFVFGFARNPYFSGIIYVLKNTILNFITILGVEYIRGIIVKNNKYAMIFITILLILLEIRYDVILNLLQYRKELFKYIFSTIIPFIFSSIFYTYLCYKFSYKVSLIARISSNMSLELLPIIPSLDWYEMGTLYIILLAISYFIYNFKIYRVNIKKKKVKIEKFRYSFILIVSMILICFMLGLFKYDPITILSNSMDPVFNKGDVVIYENLDEKELEHIPVGTIIVYSIDKQNIVHRVVSKVQYNGSIYYKTKGDSNNTEDMELVKTNQIKGIYVFHIKYIGFPSIWLHYYLNSKDAKVETK